MYKWFIQEVLLRETGKGVGALGQGKGGSHTGGDLRESSLEGNLNLIPQDLWNTCCNFPPTHCKGTGLSYSWTHQLPSREWLGFLMLGITSIHFWFSVAARETCAVGQGKSLEKESHVCAVGG